MNSISRMDSITEEKYLITPEIEKKCLNIRLGFLQKKIIQESIDIMKKHLPTPKRKLSALVIKGILIWEQQEDKSIKSFCKMKPEDRIQDFNTIISVIEEIFRVNNEIKNEDDFQLAIEEIKTLYQAKFCLR